MITFAEAKLLIAQAQAWFTGIAITPMRQDQWADALAEVHALEPRDVQTALKRIALTSHESEPGKKFWSLEIAEILEVSRAEMRRRVEQEAQSAGMARPALAASNARKRDPHLERVKRGVWVDVACKLIAEADAPEEIALRAGMSDDRVTRHREGLKTLAHDRGKRDRAASREAALAEPRIEQTDAEADRRRAELQRQAEALMMSPLGYGDGETPGGGTDG